MATSPSWQYNDARQIADVDDRSVDAAQQINWHPDRSSCQVAMALSPSRPLVFLWVATLFCCTASQMLQYTHQKQTQELDLLLNGSASRSFYLDTTIGVDSGSCDTTSAPCDSLRYTIAQLSRLCLNAPNATCVIFGAGEVTESVSIQNYASNQKVALVQWTGKNKCTIADGQVRGAGVSLFLANITLDQSTVNMDQCDLTVTNVTALNSQVSTSTGALTVSRSTFVDSVVSLIQGSDGVRGSGFHHVLSENVFHISGAAPISPYVQSVVEIWSGYNTIESQNHTVLLEDISIFGDVQSTYPFGISLYALDGTASITVLRLAVQNPIFSDETFFVNQVGTQPIRVEIDSAVFSNEASLDPSEHADAMSVDVVKKSMVSISNTIVEFLGDQVHALEFSGGSLRLTDRSRVNVQPCAQLKLSSCLLGVPTPRSRYHLLLHAEGRVNYYISNSVVGTPGGAPYGIVFLGWPGSSLAVTNTTISDCANQVKRGCGMQFAAGTVNVDLLKFGNNDRDICCNVLGNLEGDHVTFGSQQPVSCSGRCMVEVDEESYC